MNATLENPAAKSRTPIRVAFDVAPKAMETIDKAVKEFDCVDAGDLVHRALLAYIGIQRKRRAGYSEVIVRNPETRKSLVMDWPENQ
ncbi:MAG: hypothetical protein KF841_14320 [Phycisphaerae bacterium]|nr:hypothetical protein [Phycisphaerae bacterium]